MRRIISLITFATLTLTLTAAAYAGPNIKAAKSKKTIRTVGVTCGFYGTPVEFPNDVQITNRGWTSLKKGTRISWSTKNGGIKGTHTLAADLAKGQTVSVSNVVGGGVEAGHPCVAKVLRRRIKRPVGRKARK